MTEEQEEAFVEICHQISLAKSQGESVVSISLGGALSVVDLIGTLSKQLEEYQECCCQIDWDQRCPTHGDQTYGMDEGFWDAVRELRLEVANLDGQIPIAAQVVGIWDEAQNKGAPVEWSWVLRSEDITLPDSPTWDDLEEVRAPLRYLEAALEEPENHWQEPLAIDRFSAFGFYWHLRDDE